jgi:hypothetical protein
MAMGMIVVMMMPMPVGMVMVVVGMLVVIMYKLYGFTRLKISHGGFRVTGTAAGGTH